MSWQLRSVKRERLHARHLLLLLPQSSTQIVQVEVEVMLQEEEAAVGAEIDLRKRGAATTENAVIMKALGTDTGTTTGMAIGIRTVIRRKAPDIGVELMTAPRITTLVMTKAVVAVVATEIETVQEVDGVNIPFPSHRSSHKSIRLETDLAVLAVLVHLQYHRKQQQ